MVKMWLAKTNAGKFSQEITNNGGWLKQIRRLMKNMIPTNSGLICCICVGSYSYYTCL